MRSKMVAGATAEELLDVAEDRIRRFGYNGFSFRDLASDVGVKSSSVHHHFATKGDLGAKMARRYTERFLAALDEPTTKGSLPRADAVERVVALFRHSLVEKDQMCLCGMLAAEVSALPPEVATEAKIFFNKILEWLTRALGRSSRSASRAAMVLAALEGALMLARTLGRPELFDRVADEIRASID